MGKKKDVVDEKLEEKLKEELKKQVAEKKDADEEEDTPTIKSLKVIDDKYCAVEVELEKEIEKLRKKYDERQAPLLEERKKALADSAAEGAADAKEFGTPACADFWMQALNNAPEFSELLFDCDEPVLKYLDDIQRSYPDPEQPRKGLRLEFTFKENPFFTNDKLWLETYFDVEGYKPYKEMECIEVKSSVIDWKAGKNITVEKKAKEDKGKKGKKKPTKAKEEPCPSMFRILFNNLKAGDPLPEGLECVYNDEEDEDEELAECHLQNMGEVVQFVAQGLLPYAVRYYTGEACEDEDDDDEESEEEDGSDDDEESSDEESEEPAAKPKKGGKKPAPKKGGSGDAAGEKTEECKQQ